VDAGNTSGFCKGTEQDPSCLVAIYTGHQPELQTQNIAFSNDRGRTWTKYSGNPVIDLGMKDFRDPKVIWHQASRQWILVAALPKERKVRFFRSANLREWTALSDFGPAGAPEGIWECPDLFPLPVPGSPSQTRWVLVVSVNPGAPAGGSGTQYFIGSFDGKQFQNDNPASTVLWADYGADFYASQSWFGLPDSRRVWIGWHSNWQYANKEPVSPWRGAQSVPRVLSLRRFPEGIRMLQQPVEELQVLRGRPFRADHVSIEEAARRLRQSALSAETLELRAELELGTAQEAGFHLRTGNKEETIVSIRSNPLTLALDRTRSGNVSFDPRFSGLHSVRLRVVNPITLHILIDRSSIEVFANDGESVLTDRIYPSAASTGISLYSTNTGAWMRKLEVWPLQSSMAAR
jgi:fructan beta-fructosidase